MSREANETEAEVQVAVRFVIPRGKTEVSVSEALSLGYDQSSEADHGPVWVNEEEVLALQPSKTDVFVMDPFSGPAFDHITKFKCTVVGPRCLLSCMAQNTPIPELNYPMYTAAMMGLVVTCSGLDKQQKEHMRLLIERMAGAYSSAFHDGVTHLVTARAMSAKYDVAVRKETPVMMPSWVEDVWRVSASETVSAVEPRFRSHRCPSMQGVSVCVSQLGKADKDLLRKTLETHGGTYSGILEMDKTSVLVCTSPAGDKYNHARKWKIPCVTSSWVFESIERGYCLPTEPYRVDRTKTKASTPTKQDQTVAGLAEVSLCSTILDPNETMATRSVEDTINSTVALSGEVGGLVSAIRGKSTADWLMDLDLARVKKAGGFLDGCKIYLSGFSEPELVQLARVLKYGAGVRLTQLVESVSHVVHSVDTGHVAPDTAHLLSSLPALSPHMVSVQWLVESMRLGRPAPEADCPFPPAQPQPSPVSEVAPGVSVRANTQGHDTTQFEKRLLAQYGAGDMTSATATEDLSQVAPFLAGKRVNIAGFDEEAAQDYTDWITEAGGDIPYTDFVGTLDYFIVPVDKEVSSKHKFKHIVTNIWLDDCLDDGKLLPAAYFHKPITVVDGCSPLEGVVTCLSGYNGRERNFLNCLVEKLGGTAQDIFAKKDNKAKATRGSTHLICPESEGQKYAAAVKWTLPAVTRDWLLACYKDRLWVSENPFLVGESSAVTPGKPMPTEVTVEEEVREEEVTMTKDETIVEAQADDTIKSNDQNNKTLEEEISFSKQPPMLCVSPASRGSPPAAAVDTPVSVRSAVTALDTPGPAGLDTPTLERLRPKPIDVSNITVTPQRFPESQPSPSQAQRHRTGSGSDAATPTTPYGAHWSPNPSPDTRKHYKKLLDNLPRYQLSEIEVNQMERFRNLDPEAARKQKTSKFDELSKEFDKVNNVEANARHEQFLDELASKGIPVVTRDKRSFDEIMEEKYQKQGKSWKNLGEQVSKKAKLALDNSVRQEEEACAVLEGVVIAVARKHQSQSEEIHQCVKELGGQVSWQLSEEVTHFVFTGKKNDLCKEFRKAKEQDCHVVAPDWVFMCRDERVRIPESTFPHTYNPKYKLDWTQDSTMVTPRTTKTKAVTKPKLVSTKPQVEESVMEEDGDDTKVTTPPPTETMKVTEEVEANMEEISNLLGNVNTTPASTSKSSLRAGKLSGADTFKDVTPMSDKSDEEDDVVVKLPELKPDPRRPNQESQVIWRDSEEERALGLINDQLQVVETQVLGAGVTENMAMESMGSINVENLTAMIDVDTGNRPPVKRMFLVSGWGREDPDVAAAIEIIGSGELLDPGVSKFDDTVTHMMTTKVSRSEKMLGSVAAGKWVLHPAYITGSVDAGRWLDEEEYEWGREANSLITDKEGMDWKLASAARKWRIEAGGAFDGMKFILHMPEQKQGPFSRLIKAGKGEILSVKAPYSGNTGATHLLTETKYMVGAQVDYVSLAKQGIPVLKPIYLNDFLISDQPPDLERFLLDVYKPHWESIKKRNRICTDTPTSASKKTKSVFGHV